MSEYASVLAHGAVSLHGGSLACAAHSVVLAAEFCEDDGARDKVVAAIRAAVDLADNSAAHAQAVSSACPKRISPEKNQGGRGYPWGSCLAILHVEKVYLCTNLRHDDGEFLGWGRVHRFPKSPRESRPREECAAGSFVVRRSMRQM